ncbi:MAG: glycosyltransferase family 4 protein [Candidatus Cloacimonetes bacterium]|nr:glycosyltransferase family 4 protein [Candidatus Cloacimonadota bacterium]
MKILYLSKYYHSFIHNPILRLEEDFQIDYRVYFFQRIMGMIRSKQYKNTWNNDNLARIIPENKSKIVKYLNVPRNYFIHIDGYYLYYKIKKLFKKGDFDIIHSQSLTTTGILAYLLSKRLDIPYVITSHGTGDIDDAVPNAEGKTVLNRFAVNQIKKVLKNAKVNFALSEKMYHQMKSLAPEANVIINQNTYDTEIFKPAVEDKLSCSDDKINLLAVGGFVDRKNHLLLLQAMSTVVKDNKNISLTLIGGGDLKDEYISFISENSLDGHVRILPFLPHSELVKEYHKADFFVLPSKAEGFSVSLLEAMACGLPVVVSHDQGTQILVDHEVDGLIFTNYNVNDLKDKLLFLINNPEKRVAMGKNALKKVEKYQNKHHEIYDVYKQIISEKS